MTSKGKDLTIGAVIGFVAFIVTSFAISIPDRTFYIFGVGGALGGSALGAITKKKSKGWAVPLALVGLASTAAFYFSHVQVGGADPSDVAALAFSFTIMSLSLVFLMRMAGINSWAYPDEK